MRPLPTVLAELAMLRPKLVMVQHGKYFRIEDLSAQARRDARSGSPRDREALSQRTFWWGEDDAGKVFVARGPEAAPEVLFVEVGSVKEAI